MPAEGAREETGAGRGVFTPSRSGPCGGRRKEHQGRGAQSEVWLESLGQAGGVLQPAMPHVLQEGLRPPQKESSQRRKDSGQYIYGETINFSGDQRPPD